MAFSIKTWVDRLSEFPNRRKLDSTGISDTYDVTRAEGTISAEGDKFNAETMNDLEQRIADGFNSIISELVTTLACTKSDTVYALTGLTATSGKVPVLFSIPTAYAAGDTCTIDGTAYTIKTTDGSALVTGAWSAGAIIFGTVDVDAKTLTVAPSGAPYKPSVAADPDNTTDGTFYYSGHTEIPGNTTGDGEILQISHDANYVFQLAMAFHQPGAGYRVKDRGTWGPWSPMLTGYKPAIWLSVSATLTQAVSGSTICVYADGITVTLPAPSSVAHYDFLVSHAFTLATPSGNIYGSEATGTTTVSISAGHHFRLVSDGNNWTIESGNWIDVARFAFYAGGVPLATPGLRNNVISSAAPSGGADGDTWDQV